MAEERVAVLADIHGNLPALEAVLRDVAAAPFGEARDMTSPAHPHDGAPASPRLTDPAARAGAPGIGGPPANGFAALVPELGVDDIAASLAFWCGPLGFTVAYDRPAARFAYLEREGAQVMLCERNGRWDTSRTVRPYGRGLNLQITVAALQPILDGLARIGWPVFEAPVEAWYRAYAKSGFVVIAHASSSEFRGRQAPLQDVARQLGVRFVIGEFGKALHDRMLARQ